MKGLENHGNTCYFNTALQCLLYIPVLSNYFIRKPYTGECEFTKAYGNLVKMYWTRGKEHITIKNVIEAFQKEFPRFRTNEQHDVQEAVLCIIDILERSRPEIKEWFYGKKTQETIWPGGKSSNEEVFSVHLITAEGTDMGEMLQKSTDWNTIENFEDTDGKVHHLATTRMVFSTLPQVLMISFDRKSHIEIIENMIIGNSEYNLISCAVHVGIQNDGHYVSFVKRRNKWLLANDENVEEHELPKEASFYFMVYNLAVQ
tara:strand:- start:3514 stop:4290 length:777 start_codon:yes stop_codon:yes gene_type:complete